MNPHGLKTGEIFRHLKDLHVYIVSTDAVRCYNLEGLGKISWVIGSSKIEKLSLSDALSMFKLDKLPEWALKYLEKVDDFEYEDVDTKIV